MKQILILFVGITGFVSCKKDDLSELQNRISGTWELERVSGAFYTSILPPGNGKIIVIKEDGSYERRDHDSIIFKGRYQLESKKDCSGNEKKAFFITNDSTSAGDSRIVNVEGNRLLLNTSNCYADGGTVIYRKR